MVKVRKHMDCTTAFRRTIAPVDDITLRVQPLYESFTVTKIKVKVRKRPDCTITFRRAIAPVDDITLRV